MKAPVKFERHLSVKDIMNIYGVSQRKVLARLSKVQGLRQQNQKLYSVPESIVSQIFGGVEIADKVIYQTVTYHIYESKINKL